MAIISLWNDDIYATKLLVRTMLEMGSTLEAGWYPDPTSVNCVRYWNGLDWTEHVSRSSVKNGTTAGASRWPAYEGEETRNAHFDVTENFFGQTGGVWQEGVLRFRSKESNSIGSDAVICPFCKTLIVLEDDKCPACTRVLRERYTYSGESPHSEPSGGAEDTVTAEERVAQEEKGTGGEADRVEYSADYTKDTKDPTFFAKRELGDVAINCPVCERSSVAKAEKVSLVTGLLLFWRTSTNVVVGCRSCVRLELVNAARHNLVFGWWCFPWGILAPLYILSGLIRAYRPGPGELSSALSRFGINIDDVVVGLDGLTGEERRLAFGIISSLKCLDLAAGTGDAILTAGLADLEELLFKESLKKGGLAALASTVDHDLPIDVESVDKGLREAVVTLIIMRAATIVKDVSSIVAEANEILDAFWLSDTAERILFGEEDDAHSDVLGYYETLGLTPGSSLTEIRRAYRGMAMRYHPDHAKSRGTNSTSDGEVMQKVNLAYKAVLAHASRPSS